MVGAALPALGKIAGSRALRELNDMEEVKVELGRDPEQLVFIGTSDVATAAWCEQQAVLRNRDWEWCNFLAFCEDVIDVGAALGYLSAEERVEPRELVEVWRKIRLSDVERVWAQAKARKRLRDYRDGRSIEWQLERYLGDRARPVLEALQRRDPCAVREVDALPPMLRGEVLELFFAESYPSVRWWFPFEDYVVGGAPDGLTERFVYEFKTTRTPEDMILVAMRQADLYGFFFGRPEKRVQILAVHKGKIYTWHEKVDKEAALDILRRFREVERGERQAKPPASWKCKKCEYRKGCPLQVSTKSQK